MAGLVAVWLGPSTRRGLPGLPAARAATQPLATPLVALAAAALAAAQSTPPPAAPPSATLAVAAAAPVDRDARLPQPLWAAAATDAH